MTWLAVNLELLPLVPVPAPLDMVHAPPVTNMTTDRLHGVIIARRCQSRGAA
jgi:hypothetical protein